MNSDLKEYLDELSARDAIYQRVFDEKMARITERLARLNCSFNTTTVVDTTSDVTELVRACSGTNSFVIASAGLDELPTPAPSIVASPVVTPVAPIDSVAVLPASCSTECAAEAVLTSTLLPWISVTSSSPTTSVTNGVDSTELAHNNGTDEHGTCDDSTPSPMAPTRCSTYCSTAGAMFSSQPNQVRMPEAIVANSEWSITVEDAPEIANVSATTDVSGVIHDSLHSVPIKDAASVTPTRTTERSLVQVITASSPTPASTTVTSLAGSKHSGVSMSVAASISSAPWSLSAPTPTKVLDTRLLQPFSVQVLSALAPVNYSATCLDYIHLGVENATRPMQVDVDLVDSLELDTGQLAVHISSAHLENIEAEVLSIVEIIPDDTGVDQQPPWPPPGLKVLCSIDIHGLQLTYAVLKAHSSDYAPSFMKINLVKEENHKALCLCEMIPAVIPYDPDYSRWEIAWVLVVLSGAHTKNGNGKLTMSDSVSSMDKWRLHSVEYSLKNDIQWVAASYFVDATVAGTPDAFVKAWKTLKDAPNLAFQLLFDKDIAVHQLYGFNLALFQWEIAWQLYGECIQFSIGWELEGGENSASPNLKIEGKKVLITWSLANMSCCNTPTVHASNGTMDSKLGCYYQVAMGMEVLDMQQLRWFSISVFSVYNTLVHEPVISGFQQPQLLYYCQTSKLRPVPMLELQVSTYKLFSDGPVNPFVQWLHSLVQLNYQDQDVGIACVFKLILKKMLAGLGLSDGDNHGYFLCWDPGGRFALISVARHLNRDSSILFIDYICFSGLETLHTPWASAFLVLMSECDELIQWPGILGASRIWLVAWTVGVQAPFQGGRDVFRAAFLDQVHVSHDYCITFFNQILIGHSYYLNQVHAIDNYLGASSNWFPVSHNFYVYLVEFYPNQGYYHDPDQIKDH